MSGRIGRPILIAGAGGSKLETIVLRCSAAVELDPETASPRPLFLSAHPACCGLWLIRRGPHPTACGWALVNDLGRRLEVEPGPSAPAIELIGVDARPRERRRPASRASCFRVEIEADP
jgi:hypothetical protein